MRENKSSKSIYKNVGLSVEQAQNILSTKNISHPFVDICWRIKLERGNQYKRDPVLGKHWDALDRYLGGYWNVKNEPLSIVKLKEMTDSEVNAIPRNWTLKAHAANLDNQTIERFHRAIHDSLTMEAAGAQCGGVAGATVKKHLKKLGFPYRWFQVQPEINIRILCGPAFNEPLGLSGGFSALFEAFFERCISESTSLEDAAARCGVEGASADDLADTLSQFVFLNLPLSYPLLKQTSKGARKTIQPVKVDRFEQYKNASQRMDSLKSEIVKSWVPEVFSENSAPPGSLYSSSVGFFSNSQQHGNSDCVSTEIQNQISMPFVGDKRLRPTEVEERDIKRPYNASSNTESRFCIEDVVGIEEAVSIEDAVGIEDPVSIEEVVKIEEADSKEEVNGLAFELNGEEFNIDNLVRYFEGDTEPEAESESDLYQFSFGR